MHKCPECGKEFDLKRYLTKHHKRMHEVVREAPIPVAAEPLICAICAKPFPRLSHLQRHQMTHFNVKNFQCDYCHEFFTQKAHLSRHLFRKHEAEFKEKLVEQNGDAESTHLPFFVCPKCGYLFKTAYELDFHRRAAHSAARCDRCLKIVFGIDEMKRHEMKCRNEPNLCSMCGATFNKKSALLIHQNACLKRALFQCVPCGTMFKQRVELDRHFKKLHFTTEKCKNCAFVYQSPVQKARHVGECEGKIICGYCGLDGPDADHVAQNHWVRFKRPVNLINRHKSKAYLKMAKAAHKDQEAELVDNCDEIQSTDDGNDSEDEQEPSSSSEGDASEGQSSREQAEQMDFEKFDVKDFSTILAEFEADQEQDEEQFLTFQIKPGDRALSYSFKGKLPKDLVDLFPVLDETAIVLLDSVRDQIMTVQVPVSIPKGKDAKKWFEAAIVV
ncbi:unnamed protein product [Caenorhabditis bovis]|uniref:C2H2-type domain-containing protein n=1 Tax=Caenorhabditis bovis TaxID=2654633 RepID=A0A8S1EZM6_9PELO|nr:unnamed protein product [Caenorhabditis bovis]